MISSELLRALGSISNITRLMSRQAVFILAAGLFLGKAQGKEGSGLGSLEGQLRKSATRLSAALKGKVCVMDLSEAGDASYTSEFGQVAAEQLSSQLLGQKDREYQIVARRELLEIVRDAMVYGDSSATMKRLMREAKTDILVSGFYADAGDVISITIKAVSAEGGQTLVSDTLRVPKTTGLEKMMIHRFKFLPEPEEEVEAGIGLLELEAGVFYEGGDGKLYPVREGMVLTSKDNYSVYLRARQACHIYIYQVDGSQKAARLFPNPEFSRWANPVKAGEEIWVPEKDFLFLDDNPGREEIYIFATRKPTEGLENIREMSLSEIKDSIRTMGVGGKRGSEVVRKVSGARGDGIDVIQRRLVSRGDFFYQLWFIHK